MENGVGEHQRTEISMKSLLLSISLVARCVHVYMLC